MSELLFYILLIFLPTQLGRHFWPDFAFVSGIRVDYLSPTIYLTDIILGCLLLSWWLTNIKKVKYLASRDSFGMQKLKINPFDRLRVDAEQSRSIKNIRHGMAIGFFLAFLGLNVILAKAPAIALYKLLKIFEFTLLGFFVARRVTTFVQVKKIVLILSLGVLCESLIALAQFLTQSSLTFFYSSTHPLISLGFWLLGERTFNSTTLGIAQVILNGRLFLRPYATFPHPNALAGFIVVVLELGIRNWELGIGKKTSPCTLFIILYSLFIILALSTLLVTFSRSALGVAALAIIVSFLGRHFKNLKKIPAYSLAFLFLLAVLLVVYGPYIFPRALNLKTEGGLSLLRRIELGKTALGMVKSYPLLGVGLGNFIVRLNEFSQNRETIYWLQPVHNIFLLVVAETGLVGLGIFLWFLIVTYKRLISQRLAINYSLLIALSSVLILGLFDHYFLTLQQTQLLFSLVLGLCWAKIS